MPPKDPRRRPPAGPTLRTVLQAASWATGGDCCGAGSTPLSTTALIPLLCWTMLTTSLSGTPLLDDTGTSCTASCPLSNQNARSREPRCVCGGIIKVDLFCKLISCFYVCCGDATPRAHVGLQPTLHGLTFEGKAWLLATCKSTAALSQRW